jgi:hypothetical protein
LKSEKAVTPVKGGKAGSGGPKSLLKEVLLNNQRAAATPKMTPRGHIRILALKTPRSVKQTGARRPLWSEVVAKNKDQQQPAQVRFSSLPIHNIPTGILDSYIAYLGTGTGIFYNL